MLRTTVGPLLCFDLGKVWGFRFPLRDGREMAQKIKFSLVKHENLNSDPQHPREEQGMAVKTCNSNTGKAETGGCPGVPGQWEILSQNTKRKVTKTANIDNGPDRPIHTHAHTHTHTHTIIHTDEHIYSHIHACIHMCTCRELRIATS